MPLRDFDLEPFAAALLHVAGVAALRDDAFELLFACRGEQRLTVRKRVRHSEAFIRAEHLLQVLLPNIEVNAGQVVAVGVEDVEKVVDDRQRAVRRAALAHGLQSGALLHEREARTSAFIERADLSVEHSFG